MNKKILLITILALLLVMPLGLAVGTAPSSSDTVAYYELENYIDSVGADDFTAPADAPTLATGIISNGYDFDETNNEYLVSDRKTGALSVSLWMNTAFNTPTDAKNRIIIGTISGAGSNNWHLTIARMNGASPGQLMLYTEDGADYCIDAIAINDGNWHFITITIDGTTGTLYVDGNSKGTVTVTNGYTFGTSTNDIILGNDADNDGDGFSGIIDEVAFFDTVLTTSEITYMNNTGSPTSAQQYPFIANFTVSVVDEWSGNAVNGINVSIDGVNYINSTGNSIVTNLLRNDTALYDITISANDYFNKTYSNVNITNILAGTLYQSSINFTAKELFTNNTLSNVTFYVNSSENTTFHLSEGWYNVTAVKSDYYNLTYEFFVVALDNLTVDVPGLYNSVVSVNLTDAVTASLISSSSYVTVDNGAGFVQTFNEVNGSLYMNLLQDNYSLTLWASGYVYRYETVIVNNITEFFNFSLYANNSVWVTAKNLSSDASLVNFSVSISGADFSSSVNDSGSGRVVFDNVSSGVYSVVVSKDGFSSSSYVLSMAGGSHQSIVAYLFTGDDTVLFTTVDSFSNAIIEGSTGGLYSLLNDTWVLVSSQLSDITGRIQFDILSDVSYKFIFDAVGYDQKVVLLKPLFASYTARLDPSVSVTPDVNVGDWIFSMNNSGEFFNGVNNSFLVSVLSTMGTLEYYYVNITDESGLVTELFCGVAGGCDNSTWLDISGASYDDVIGIELWVKESGVVLKYFKTLYLVQDVYNDFTARAWRDADFGDLEKVLAASLVLLILVGFVSVGASFLGVPVVTVSAVVLGVGAEFFGAGIGFFPASIGHLIALGCLLIVLFGRGEI